MHTSIGMALVDRLMDSIAPASSAAPAAQCKSNLPAQLVYNDRSPK